MSRLVSEIVGWRLYFLHRGNLCSPMVGDLTPVLPHEKAICLHENHEPPADDCACGFRVGDNTAALRPAAEAMLTPMSMLPVHARLAMEHKRDESAEYGWPMTVLSRWDFPTPALVRVTGYGARPAEEVAQNGRQIAAAVSNTSRGRHQMIPEGHGMWRACSVRIAGPVIADRSVYDQNMSLVSQNYDVHAVQVSDPFLDILKAVQDGWLPTESRAARRARRGKPNSSIRDTI